MAASPNQTSAVPASQVRIELQKVQASAVFERAPQLQRFLHFLVEEELAGRGERLKEYVIGVEVFGRPATYDPRLDSLVRVEALRLRAALETYYGDEGHSDPSVIELPKGTYRPSFRRAAEPAHPPTAKRSAGAIALVAVVAVGLLIVAPFALRSRRVQALTERDSIVLTEFANSSGDPIFDDALKQGLTMELEQSPFLNIVSDRRAAQTLAMMGRFPAEHLTPELAREVCLRTGSNATVGGSIARLGSQYVIALTATNCSTGDAFVHLQVQADRKEAVLAALGTAASDLRRRLGESLNSIRRFDTPIEEATTPSLPALQAYSLGRRIAREKGSPADLPYYQRAIELDPNFAVAHAALGISYVNLGQPSVASEHLTKAYELRDRVSEREKYRIAAYYVQVVTGDLEKARANYELWKQSYPRDFAPYINLGISYTWRGEYEKAVGETAQALRLEPTNVLPYSNLAAHYIKLGRVEEGKAVLDQARSRNLTSKFVRSIVCYLAFLRNDAATVEQQLAEVRDKPGDEDPLVSQQSDTEAYFGRLRRARALSRRAAELAIHAQAKEAAAGWLVNAALREAEYGNATMARKQVAEALRLAPGRDVKALAALALARSGDLPQAETLLRDLEKTYPLNTMIHVYWAPTIRAAGALSMGNAAGALTQLRTASPYELGSPPPIGLATLYPVYLRGEAYLLRGQGEAAAQESKKILDHPTLVLNFPVGALARLQLARGRALAGDRTAARQAYQDFLDLWQSADPDIPILRNAHAEYAHLK